MANNSTITLLESEEWIKRFVYNQKLSIGSYKEPLISSANQILQTILGKPFRWPFNRVVTGFVAVAGTQDYSLGAWAASTAFAKNFNIIDSNGNAQKVTTAGTSGATAPSWNATTGGTTADGTRTLVWTNQGSIPHASPSFTYGWIENASVQDPTTSKWTQVSNKVDLALDSSSARPMHISAELDSGTGSLIFRLMPVPDKAYPVAITLQQGAPLFTSLNQTWSPIPDNLSYVYQKGLLAEMFEFADDPRSIGSRQKFIASLLGAAEGLTATEINIFLNQWQAISGSPLEKQIQLQQGNQARGV